MAPPCLLSTPTSYPVRRQAMHGQARSRDIGRLAKGVKRPANVLLIGGPVAHGDAEHIPAAPAGSGHPAGAISDEPRGHGTRALVAAEGGADLRVDDVVEHICA